MLMNFDVKIKHRATTVFPPNTHILERLTLTKHADNVSFMPELRFVNEKIK